MNSLEPRRKTSWHLADLQDKSAPFINQVIQDLNVTPTDLKESKRAVTVARYTAAKMIADSWECKNAALYNLVMERTEGKVPDVRFNFGGDDIIKRLESARARMISDGAISDSTLQLEASDAATGDLDAADPIYIDSRSAEEDQGTGDQAGDQDTDHQVDTCDQDKHTAPILSTQLGTDQVDSDVCVEYAPSYPGPACLPADVPTPPGGDPGSHRAEGVAGDLPTETEIPPEPIQSAAAIKAEMPARPPRARMKPGPKPKIRERRAPGPTRRALERLLAEDEQTANAAL
jgi:hypothetical protein